MKIFTEVKKIVIEEEENIFKAKNPEEIFIRNRSLALTISSKLRFSFVFHNNQNKMKN